MFTSTLDLAQVADIAAAMTITNTDDSGLMIVHQGTHPDYGQCTLAQCEERGVLVSDRAFNPTA